jgi:hypothetical protein
MKTLVAYGLIKGVIEERRYGIGTVFVPYISFMSINFPLEDGKLSFDDGTNYYYLMDAKAMVMLWFENKGVPVGLLNIEYRKRLL